MSKRFHGPVLNFEQISTGYEKTVEHALRLLDSSMHLNHQGYSEVALGTAELGQEEIGKTVSFLAAFSLPDDPGAWDWFWRAWKDHQQKAYRAFLYQFMNPTRMQIHRPEGGSPDGNALRKYVQLEKEFSLYVNFDETSRTFISPAEAVTFLEVNNRIVTLLHLALTASHVRAALVEDPEFRCRALSEVVFRVCTRELPPDEIVPSIQQLARKSPRHAELVDALNTGFEKVKAWLLSVVQQGDKRDKSNY